jgi:regulator of replication initiation timing
MDAKPSPADQLRSELLTRTSQRLDELHRETSQLADSELFKQVSEADQLRARFERLRERIGQQSGANPQ